MNENAEYGCFVYAKWSQNQRFQEKGKKTGVFLSLKGWLFWTMIKVVIFGFFGGRLSVFFERVFTRMLTTLKQPHFVRRGRHF